MSDYSNDSFWEKCKSVLKSAGCEVIEKALWLYFVAQKESVPASVKATIYGALAYFILPLDAIPDITPLIGFSDDLGALMLAIKLVSDHIDDEVKSSAKAKMASWGMNC